jgi:lipid II:glycine glycyltransferase (peptidoglycan interpeptide bridge formation enzyme)
MVLKIYEHNEAKLRDDIINNSINGTLYHRWEWLKIVEKHSSCKLLPLVYFDTDDNNPFGAIPLFYAQKYGIKMVFSPPPGTSITLGPVLSKKDYKQHKFELAYLEFQANVDQFINKLGTNYISMLSSPGIVDFRPFLWARYTVTPSYTYKIDLRRGKEEVWNNLSKYLKKNIKNAQKKNIIIEEKSGIDNINYVFDSVQQRFAEQNMNLSLKRAYIHDIVRQFDQSALKYYQAYYNEEVIGALLCTIYKDTISAWIGGVRNASNAIESNELLYWEAISRAIQGGYSWFEIIGANTRRLCEFKARYCPEVQLFFQVKKTDWLGSLAEKMYFLMQKKYF